MYEIGYVPGGWDLFHVGHLNLLRRAREECRRLVVGVVTDECLLAVKGRAPVVPLEERMEIVGALSLVDEVVVDRSPDKRLIWQEVRFDVIFKGDDWQGTAKGAELARAMSEVGVDVRYFPYTKQTSSSALRSVLSI